MTTGAVVFGGGGVAGIAWEIGVLYGIQETEPAALERVLHESTLLIGTSAGAAVAAQVASGTPLVELFSSQLSEETAEIAAELDIASYGAQMAEALKGADSAEEVRRRIGAMALTARTPSAESRRQAIAARLPVATWAERRVELTAVDAKTGELEVFTRDSGVDLVDAVAASCAVPGIWPTVDISGRHFMDGGMRSLTNADLAAGRDPVLIIVPSLEQPPAGSPLGEPVRADDLTALEPARVKVIYADTASIAAFGSNPLDPATRGPAAREGQRVGRELAAAVAAFWS